MLVDNLKYLYERNKSTPAKIYWPACFSALAFLPEEHVLEGFQYLADNDDYMEDIEVQSFITYFESTYIGVERGRGLRRRRCIPLFPINVWNVFMRIRDNLPRSNNSMEAFHQASKPDAPHPHIWKFIAFLQREENLAKFYRTLDAAGRERRRKKKYINIEKSLHKLTERYEQSNDLNQFLRAIAHNLHAFDK